MELQSLLGLCPLSRSFVQTFPYLVAVLDKKLQKDQPQTFDELSEDDIAVLKRHKSNMSRPFCSLFHSCKVNILEIQTHVTNKLALSRYQRDKMRHIIQSKIDFDCPKRLGSICHSAIGILCSNTGGLLGSGTTLVVAHTMGPDHTLKWVSNFRDSIELLPRWQLRISESEFKVAHCDGTWHQAADTPSKLGTM